MTVLAAMMVVHAEALEMHARVQWLSAWHEIPQQQAADGLANALRLLAPRPYAGATRGTEPRRSADGGNHTHPGICTSQPYPLTPPETT